MAGKKGAPYPDYYLNGPDYPQILEPRRHDPHNTGANFLYLDMHVGIEEPNRTFAVRIDPWDLPAK